MYYRSVISYHREVVSDRVKQCTSVNAKSLFLGLIHCEIGISGKGVLLQCYCATNVQPELHVGGGQRLILTATALSVFSDSDAIWNIVNHSPWRFVHITQTAVPPCASICLNWFS